MSNTDVKEDRKYTKEHEWAKLVDGTLRIGITAFAVEQLGDITLVAIDVKPGDRVEAGKVFGTIESVKTLSDLFAPISGTVKEVNPALEDAPETINDDCWEAGWMLNITPDGGDDSLMTPEAYQAHIEASSQ